MVIGEVALQIELGAFAPAAAPARQVPPAPPELTIVVHQGRWQRATKRAIDVMLASVGLVVTFPLFALLALGVRLTSKGPALFRHTRVGRNGAPIQITKFRTMVPDAVTILEHDAELKRRYIENGFKLRQEDDPRITRFGRVLRRLSVDELPQLWDVLRGRMSLVGPRPVMAEELSNYGHYLGAYLAVKPGVTGLWQVHGRSDVGFPERAKIDYFYAARWTIWLDVKVLLRTVPAVARRRGAY